MNYKYLLFLLLSLGTAGLISYAFGLVGLFKPLFILPLLLPSLYFAYQLTRRSLQTQFTPGEKLLLILIAGQFMVYSLGFFVPETGFDALWYHLPEAQVYASTGRLAPIPELLYSTMPRLGEIFFAIGFLLSKSLVITKFISFLFAIGYTLVTYLLSSKFLPRPHSLLVALTVNSFYLVSWQASSAYVDLLAAVFQLAAFSFFPGLCGACGESRDGVHQGFSRDQLVLAGLFTGFALGVKFQSLTSFLAILMILVICLRRIRYTAYYILTMVLVASPWYLDNYFRTGHPLYPTNLPSLQLAALNHAGATSLVTWLLHQTFRLPLLFWDLTFHPSDYLSPILLILLPILIFQIKKIIKNKITLLAITYTLIALLSWWFLPPPETRYLLGALPPLVILEIWSVTRLPRYLGKIKNYAYIFIFLSVGLNLFLRVGSSLKYLPVIFGQITPSQYIMTQTNAFNAPIVNRFYSGYWQHYRYPKK